MVPERIEKLQNRIKSNGIDALLISDLNNIRYLCGFIGSSGWMLVTENKSYLAVDFRYLQQARQEVVSSEIVNATGDMASWLLPLIYDNDIKVVGFESSAISFMGYKILNEAISQKQNKIDIVATSNIVESLRAIKEKSEIQSITTASLLADKAVEYAKSLIPDGITEKQLAWELEKYLRENNSESVPFDIIVASGLNAALPHARPTDKVINKAEPVIIDIGAKIDGYCSDLSRTLCLGRPDETFSKIYDIVLSAQMAALSIINVNMTGSQADSIARTIIEKCGYADKFGHGLGHGIGLSVHEFPRLGPKSDDLLQENMVFSIEPGIYVENWGGIRIEDTVIMENGKVTSLSNSNKF